MRDLRVVLANGHPALGSWLMYPDALVAETMARSGFDWLLIDMEHGPLSLTDAASMLTAVRTTDVVPYVRPAWNESAHIQQALDLGCAGIIVPVVNTAEDARRVVQDARFPPLGQRSRGGVRQQLAFNTDAMTYAERANQELVVLVQIETSLAVQNVEAICAVEGIDGVFLGPNDLASSRGQRWPDVWTQDEDYRAMVRRVAAVALEHQKIAGFLAKDAAMAVEVAEMGYRFIAVSNDATYLMNAAKNSVNATWDALGYEPMHEGHGHAHGHDHGDHDHGDHDHDHGDHDHDDHEHGESDR